MAKNLPMKHGTPLACDVTIVPPLRVNGEARPRAAGQDGVAIAKAEKDKAKTYPELVHSSRCRLIVLACEVGGRWSDTCVWLVRKLAENRSSSAPKRLRRSTDYAWEARWWSMLSVAAQDALAATLVDDALDLLHGWKGEGPPLGQLLHLCFFSSSPLSSFSCCLSLRFAQSPPCQVGVEFALFTPYAQAFDGCPPFRKAEV